MKPDTKPYQIQSYTDIFAKYFFDHEAKNCCECPEYVLVFVFSGEMDIQNNNHRATVRKGEYIFLRKDINTVIIRKASGTESFSSVFMGFNTTFLHQFYRRIHNKKSFLKTGHLTKGFLELPRNPYLDSIYISLLSYRHPGIQPIQQIIEIKMTEAIFSLLLTDERFYCYLFELPPPPEYYVTKIPHQLMTYPVKWIIRRKLQTTFIKIRRPGNAVNIYMEARYNDWIVARQPQTLPYDLISPN